MSIRVGIGYDVHKFKDDIPLFLGGVKIEYSRGLIGHSDADVLLHAICDALLGAAGLGDIGQHYPDHSDEFKGIDSKILLQKTFYKLKDSGYRIGNLDAVLILQKPKISSYVPEMRKIIAQLLEADVDVISIKATTTEKLGFEGREEGIAAQAIVLIQA